MDKNDRRKVDIKTQDGQKYGFFESLIGYTDADFNKMIELLKAQASQLMKFTQGVERVNRGLRDTTQDQ